jgi:hypothetical protein
MIFSIKYLLNIRIYERITRLKCLTWRDFFNFDRRSLRIIYEVKWTFVDYNYSIQSSIILNIIIINSYSLWYRLETTHAKNAICITERKIFKRKKNSFTSIQSLSLFSDDVASSKCRMNDVFELFICCRFQYQELKIVCVTDQTNEMSNVLIEIFSNQWKLR